jgi:hypothetical protein
VLISIEIRVICESNPRIKTEQDMRTIALILIVVSLLFFGCSSKKDAGPASPTDRYIESVNTVSGVFSVEASLSENKQPFTISVKEAYGRVVRSLADPNKKDVLIVLVENPLPRFALAVGENDDAQYAEREFSDVLKYRDARGLLFRVPVDPQTGKPTVWAYFSGNEYHFGNLTPQIKSLTGDQVEGQITSSVASQKSDINFSVRLQPDGWTGGAFYQQAPTALAAGQASGQVEIDGRSVKLNHAYARLVEFDMFDESKDLYKVWFTETPVDPNALYGARTNDLLAVKQKGNAVVLTYASAGPVDRDELDVWLLANLHERMRDDQLSEAFRTVPGVERDYVRHTGDAIEGRLFTAFPISDQDHTYKVDLLFNVEMLQPVATDGPVTAGNGGSALPADGGEPGKAYLAAVQQMKAAKDFDQKRAVWLNVVAAEYAERIKRDLDTTTPEGRRILVEVFAPLDDLKIVGGFIKDNKATLRISGTGRDGKAVESVNLQLENGQWKIGRREIREE